MRYWWRLLAAITVVAFLAAACGSDDDDGDIVDDGSGTTNEVPDGSADGGTGNSESGEDGGASEGGGSGTSGEAGSIVFGDETIILTSARCFLQEQDAAAGGGKILFTAQGFGDDAAGEPIALDISRFDEDSQFSGDKSNVVIGDPFSGTAASWDANGPIGTVSVVGSTVSATGLTWVNGDDFSEKPGSFSLDC